MYRCVRPDLQMTLANVKAFATVTWQLLLCSECCGCFFGVLPTVGYGPSAWLLLVAWCAAVARKMMRNMVREVDMVMPF